MIFSNSWQEIKLKFILVNAGIFALGCTFVFISVEVLPRESRRGVVLGQLGAGAILFAFINMILYITGVFIIVDRRWNASMATA